MRVTDDGERAESDDAAADDDDPRLDEDGGKSADDAEEREPVDAEIRLAEADVPKHAELEEAERQLRRRSPLAAYLATYPAEMRKPLGRDEFVALLLQNRAHPTEWRARRLLGANLLLVVSFALRFQRRHYGRVAIEDLVQEGMIILHTKAYPKFDPARGYAVTTYATWWIRQSLQRFLQNNADGRARRLPVYLTDRWARIVRLVTDVWIRENGRQLTDEEIAAELGLTVDVVRKTRYAIIGTPAASLQQPLGAARESDDLWTFEHVLSDRQADAETVAQAMKLAQAYIQLFARIETMLLGYPIADRIIFIARLAPRERFPALTLEPIGQYLGVTRERVRQREDKLISRLAKRLGMAPEMLIAALQSWDAVAAVAGYQGPLHLFNWERLGLCSEAQTFLLTDPNSEAPELPAGGAQKLLSA